MKLSLKSTAKLVSALIIASPLLMVGCTCSKQENPDQVVPMEDPGMMDEAAPADDGSMMDETTPSDENMAPPTEDGSSMDTEEITD